MLQQDGSISFIDELIALVEGLLAAYERERGAPCSPVDQGLALSYVLGVLQCDLCALGDALAQAPLFHNVHPQRLFEECCLERQAAQGPQRAEQLRRIQDKLRARGWPSGQESAGGSA